MQYSSPLASSVVLSLHPSPYSVVPYPFPQRRSSSINRIKGPLFSSLSFENDVGFRNRQRSSLVKGGKSLRWEMIPFSPASSQTSTCFQRRNKKQQQKQEKKKQKNTTNWETETSLDVCLSLLVQCLKQQFKISRIHRLITFPLFFLSL